MIALRIGKIWPRLPHLSPNFPLPTKPFLHTVGYGSRKTVHEVAYHKLPSKSHGVPLVKSLASMGQSVFKGLPSIAKSISENQKVSPIPYTSLKRFYY